MKPRPLPLIVIMLFALCAVLMSLGSSPVAAAAASPLPAATEGAPPPASLRNWRRGFWTNTTACWTPRRVRRRRPLELLDSGGQR